MDGTFDFEDFFDNYNKREKDVIQQNNDKLAKVLYSTYSSFVKVGFDKEQAFQLLMVQYQLLMALNK